MKDNTGDGNPDCSDFPILCMGVLFQIFYDIDNLGYRFFRPIPVDRHLILVQHTPISREQGRCDFCASNINSSAKVLTLLWDRSSHL
jgi:hypothetical protein